MIKILAVSPMSKDANSFFRCMGPLSYLEKYAGNGEKFQIKLSQDEIGNPQPHGMSGLAWDAIGRFDLVYMHRPCRPDDLTILRVARNMNVPVIVDYDDWLFDVPPWNPVAHMYQTAGVQNIVATMMACADVITVSTSALYDKVRPVNKNTIIVPNCYRSDLYSYRAASPPPANPVYAWRGTNTHEGDVLSVLEGWRKLSSKTLFFGGPPWSLLSQMPTNSYQPMGGHDPFLYMKMLYKSAPKVVLVPLIDCLFNRVKSNIAYHEALHAGALCVAPDLPEWKRPGVISYQAGNSESFLISAEAAMQMHPDDHAKEVAIGFDEMKKRYDTTVISPIREQIFETTLASDFERNSRDPWDQLVGVWALSILKGKPAEMPHVPQALLEEKGLV